MVTNSSAEPAGSVSVFPDGDLYLNLCDYDGVYSDFIKMVLVPEDQRVIPPGSRPFEKGTQYRTPVIFICGHGSRDSRCGVLGSLLRDEFERQVKRFYGERSQTAPVTSIVSHIGGHVFAGMCAEHLSRQDLVDIGSSLLLTAVTNPRQLAEVGLTFPTGNVIVYIPPAMEPHALAGKGIWYGRVEPKHVEGILKATLGQGKVIKELYRGGLDIDSGPVRLDNMSKVNA